MFCKESAYHSVCILKQCWGAGGEWLDTPWRGPLSARGVGCSLDNILAICVIRSRTEKPAGLVSSQLCVQCRCPLVAWGWLWWKNLHQGKWHHAMNEGLCSWRDNCETFFKDLFIYYLFSAAPSLHCCAQGFSNCNEWVLLYSCSVRASHCDGFSCRAWAWGAWATVVAAHGLRCSMSRGIF